MLSMVESNYEILNLADDASKKEIQKAYRTLVLQHHSDRGGNDEKFKRIKQAYEDLQKGKKYPDTLDEKKSNAKFYSGTSEDEKLRKNLLLSNDVAKEMKTAEEWVAALSRTNTTGMRLFGSNEFGKMEFERKPTKTLSIKGKFWAGNFKYDNSVMMWGSITSPYFSPYEKHKTHIHLTDGNFRMIDSIQNKYDIDGGAKITVDNGDMEVGNVSGKKQRVSDPQGRVGMSIMKEYFTELKALNGKLVAGNVTDTVKLDADTVIALNLVDNIKIKGREILVYGSKVTHNVEFFLKNNGKIRFYDQGSGFDISDDATIQLEVDRIIKIRDLKHAKMISHGGKDIRYEDIVNLGTRKKSKNGTPNNFGSFKKIFGR